MPDDDAFKALQVREQRLKTETFGWAAAGFSTAPAAPSVLRPVTYVGSRPIYSNIGTLIQLGCLPWALAYGFLSPKTDVPTTAANAVIALAPLVLWLGAKWSGPDGRWRWFYRARGRLTLDDAGVAIEAPTVKPGRLPWSAITEMRRRGLWMVLGNGGDAALRISSAMSLVCTEDCTAETSIALAIAAYQPDRLIAEDPQWLGLPIGLRLREPGDEPSVLVTRPPTRADQRGMAAVLVTILVLQLLQDVFFR